MSVRLARLLEAFDALALPAEPTVLEGGCGPGHLVDALRARGCSVNAIDTSRGMLDLTLERLRQTNRADQTHLGIASIDQLPFADGSFDLATTCGVIEYLSEDGPTLSEFRRVLKPGGYFLLPVTNAWSPVFAFDPLVEALKRIRWLREGFNFFWTRLGHTPLRGRRFTVRRHSPRKLHNALDRSGFEPVDAVYFYFVPWPRPLDAFLPGPTHAIGRRMERFGRSWLGPLAEGYLAIARKR